MPQYTSRLYKWDNKNTDSVLFPNLKLEVDDAGSSGCHTKLGAISQSERSAPSFDLMDSHSKEIVASPNKEYSQARRYLHRKIYVHYPGAVALTPNWLETTPIPTTH